jgi:hypothetical protein
MIINVGDADIDGVELDLTAVPVDGLEFGPNAMVLNAETTSDNDLIGVDSGARLPISPELKVSTARIRRGIYTTLGRISPRRLRQELSVRPHLLHEFRRASIPQAK